MSGLVYYSFGQSKFFLLGQKKVVRLSHSIKPLAYARLNPLRLPLITRYSWLGGKVFSVWTEMMLMSVSVVGLYVCVCVCFQVISVYFLQRKGTTHTHTNIVNGEKAQTWLISCGQHGIFQPAAHFMLFHFDFCFFFFNCLIFWFLMFWSVNRTFSIHVKNWLELDHKLFWNLNLYRHNFAEQILTSSCFPPYSAFNRSPTSRFFTSWTRSNGRISLSSVGKSARFGVLVSKWTQTDGQWSFSLDRRPIATTANQIHRRRDLSMFRNQWISFGPSFSSTVFGR